MSGMFTGACSLPASDSMAALKSDSSTAFSGPWRLASSRLKRTRTALSPADSGAQWPPSRSISMRTGLLPTWRSDEASATRRSVFTGAGGSSVTTCSTGASGSGESS